MINACAVANLRNIGLIGLFVLLASQPSAGQTRGAGIDEGAKALKKAARFPWYDRQTDKIRTVTLPPNKRPLEPSNWEAKPKPKTNWNWSKFWDVIQVMAWIAMVVFLVFIIVLVMRSVGVGFSFQTADSDDQDERMEEARIAHLPFPVQKKMGNLLSEAKRLYESGDYAKAIVFLFSHQLVQLDKAQLIHLTRGKTNRQYLSELRRKPDLRRLLTATMLVFEDAFFGNYSIGKERFDECWNRLDEFHGLTKESSASA